MQFFQYMEEIYLDNYDSFLNKIDSERDKIQKKDYGFLNKVTHLEDINSVERIPNGCFSTLYKGINFECFFYYKEEAPLYVFLNGAKSNEQREKPVFSRWSYYSFLDGSMLNIADPMLKLYPSLKLGWYYGDNQRNIRALLSELVVIISSKYNIKKSDIIFVGSSGGGAATFECSNYITGSKAIAINPQIVLNEYGYAKEFIKITKNNLIEDKIWNRHNGIHYIINNEDNPIIIIINLRSMQDIKQLQNICRAKKIKVKYGINIFDNLIIWIYDGDGGIYKSAHEAQEYYCIWFFIEHLIKNINNKKYLKDNESLYLLINEFWHEYWVHNSKWDSRIKCIQKILEDIRKKKKVAIFGTGYKAEEISNKVLGILGSNIFNIQMALDNNIDKEGKTFLGLKIEHPSNIKNWKELYIIITTEVYLNEIRNQLENKGLIYRRDFISYEELYD